MASECEASCDADPNFAVICAFLEKFGAACGLRTIDFLDLQEMLENTQEVSQILIDLHIKLMRKMRKSINSERWERGIVKMCHTYSNQDAWEIERFGYKKARLSAKLRLLKELLEMQFDNNTSFKNKINVITAKELRSQPIGKDKLGNAYWYQADDNCQVRVYKEDPDEETWALVAKDREGLVTLISKLSDNHDSSSTDVGTNDDSNSLEDNKPVLDTGQQDSNSSKKTLSSDDDKPVLKAEVDDEDTKMDGKSLHIKATPEIQQQVEEKKPELSGIKEKYIRSDNFIQSNRKAVESAGFVDIENSDLKRPLDEDIEEPSLIKRPRTDRPTLLGNKKKPYLEEELDEEEEVEEEEEEEEDYDDEQDEQDDNDDEGEEEEEEDEDDDDSEVSDEIEEPLMLVTGKGAGQANNCGNPIVGEAVEEDVMYFHGDGSGKECETGNDDEKKKEEPVKNANDEPSSIMSQMATTTTKNSFKLGTIIDSKTDQKNDKDALKVVKRGASRWDIGKPPSESDRDGETVPNIGDVDDAGTAVLKKPMFFFGPGSGFNFKAPQPIIKPVNMGFGVAGQNSTASISIGKGEENIAGGSESIVLRQVNDGEGVVVNTVESVETNDNNVAQTRLDDYRPGLFVEESEENEKNEEIVANASVNETLRDETCKVIDDLGNTLEEPEDTNIEDQREAQMPQIEDQQQEIHEMKEPEASTEVVRADTSQIPTWEENKETELSDLPLEPSEIKDIELIDEAAIDTTDAEEVTSVETNIHSIEALKKEELPNEATNLDDYNNDDDDDDEAVALSIDEESATLAIDEEAVFNLVQNESIDKTNNKQEAELDKAEIEPKVEELEADEKEPKIEQVQEVQNEDKSTVIDEGTIASGIFEEKDSGDVETSTITNEAEQSYEKIEDEGVETISEPKETVNEPKTPIELPKVAVDEDKPEETVQQVEKLDESVLVQIVPGDDSLESLANDKVPVIENVAVYVDDVTGEPKELSISDIEDKPQEQDAPLSLTIEQFDHKNDPTSSETGLSSDEPLIIKESKRSQVAESTSLQPALIKVKTLAALAEAKMIGEREPQTVELSREDENKMGDFVTPQNLTGLRDTISECMEIEEMQVASTYSRCFRKDITEVPNETNVLDNKPVVNCTVEQKDSIIAEDIVDNVVEVEEQKERQDELPTDLSPKKQIETKSDDDNVIEVNNEGQGDLLDLSQKQEKSEVIVSNSRQVENFEESNQDTPEESKQVPLISKGVANEDVPVLALELTKPTIANEDPYIVRSLIVEGATELKTSQEIGTVVPTASVEHISSFSAVPIAQLQHGNEILCKNKATDNFQEPLVIQEIGSLTALQPKKSKLSDEIEKQIVPLNEEEDIIKIREEAKTKTAFQVHVDSLPDASRDFVETPCKKRNISLLMDVEQEDQCDSMNNDDDNISEPMELEDAKHAEIIEHDDKKQEGKIVQVAEVKEVKKVSSLQSLSLDFTGEAPDLSEVHALVKRARKRGPDEAPSPHNDDDDNLEEASGGKRRKMRGKRTVDKSLRRSIEDAKNKEVSSSDEAKVQEPAVKSEKKPKAKRKRTILGLDIPEDGSVLDAPMGLRQSRRIAQIKIKEEAERRKLEEIALEEMKNSQKRKSKKDEDKDYKAEKRKKIVIEEESSDNDTPDVEVEDTKEKKKKKKQRKHRKFDESNPWRSSSDSSSEDSHVEEEEEEEEETYVATIKSDHEFSPESDLEDPLDPQPLKRARTVRKEDEELADAMDDTDCQKCHKSDHPEWILLCDGCDAGWHCSCLRPALLVIPEGDWYCPPCQHNSLIKLLQEKLVEFDKVQTKKEVEIRRKERLAYVGISLANVLPAKDEDTAKMRRERERSRQNNIKGDDSESDSGSDSKSASGSSSESSSSSSSESDDEPIYKLRQRRQAHSYRFKDYDELIKSAIQEDVDVKQQSQQEYQSKGKDMATIVQAEALEHKEEQQPIEPKEEDSEEDVVKPAKKILGKKKHRRLNSLDISSEEDEDSDEDFKGSSSDNEEDEYEEYNYSGSSSSSYVGRRKKRKGAVRRSTRARISRYDREFINDDSEDSEEPKRSKRGRSDWDESEESEEEESDGSWGRKKKRGGKVRKAVISSPKSRSKKSKKKKKKNQDDSDVEVYRRKKAKKLGGFDDDDGGGRRRTRGKKINYLDALGTDSEEEGRRRNQVKDEESEDEFVLNEEEDDVQDDEGRDGDDSDDSNIGGLVPAVKKGSKKGKGKGGIKRIKRAQGEEEEALFPPLPNAPAAESIALGELEPNPIEQINKNLEAMDEKEIGMMMEEEEYANKQLQMVAAQLEKEKRRKELEAKRLLELSEVPQPAPVPPVLDVVPSVIRAMPDSIPPQGMPHLQPMHAAPLQPIHHDHPPPMMPTLLQQSPMHHHSPQAPPPPMMLLDAATPKKRGRKPKSALTSPEIMSPGPGPSPAQASFIPTPPLSDKGDDELSFNADGTPKKRRGRGKGKKTLEKEAAAAAAAAATCTPPPPRPASEPTKEPERVHVVPPPSEPKTVLAPAEIPIPMVGGKLGVASAPQPFSQSQPKPSVITRMLQAQSGQPAYPVGAVSHNFGPERPPGPQLGPRPPFIPVGAVPVPPPRGLHPGAFRPAANHYPVIRSGAPPIRPQNMSPHLYHHPLENPPPTGGQPPIAERSSPALPSPSSASPLSSKSDQPVLPQPPPYAVRPSLVRFPAGMPPRHPQLIPQMHARPPYPGVPPHNFYASPYGEGGSQFQQVPPQYQEQFAGGDADGGKNYDEENGEFGGLVSYFSSQREDDLDT